MVGGLGASECAGGGGFLYDLMENKIIYEDEDRDFIKIWVISYLFLGC